MQEVVIKKTIGKYKKGLSYNLSDGLAKAYTKLGIAEFKPYHTKVMTPDIYSMSRDQLYEFAVSKGVKVHHRAGIEKIKEALGIV